MGGPLVNRQPKEKKMAAGGMARPTSEVVQARKASMTRDKGKIAQLQGVGTNTAPRTSMEAYGAAKGGQLSKSNGIAKKGRTSTKMVKMAKGGMKGCK
jgi:hypothetical protein